MALPAMTWALPNRSTDGPDGCQSPASERSRRRQPGSAAAPKRRMSRM